MLNLTSEDVVGLWVQKERVFCLDHQLAEALNVLYRYQYISDGVLVKHELGGFAIYPCPKQLYPEA